MYRDVKFSLIRTIIQTQSCYRMTIWCNKFLDSWAWNWGHYTFLLEIVDVLSDCVPSNLGLPNPNFVQRAWLQFDRSRLLCTNFLCTDLLPSSFQVDWMWLSLDSVDIYLGIQLAVYWSWYSWFSDSQPLLFRTVLITMLLAPKMSR